MILFSFLIWGCGNDPTTMPTKKQIDQERGFTKPSPLYQLLYESQPLPKPSSDQQRVRILIWLQKLEFNDDQLRLLSELRKEIQNRKEEIIKREQEAAAKLVESETPIYNTLWEALKEGKNLKNQNEAIAKLRAARSQDPALDIQKLRIDSIRAIFEAQNDFLQTLSPEQEQMIMESLFFLRHHIDPIGTPDDFYSMIGRTYEPGQYAVLTRGGSDNAQQPLNIGGLWTDKDELSGKAFHEAKRELLLYLVLLEPGFDEALQVALELR